MALQQLGINASKPFFMIIAGKSGSGKSHFLRFLMKEINIHHPFDYGIVMSNTCFEKESFDYIPKKYIFEEFNEAVIKNMIKIRKNNLSKGVQKYVFLILDDCIAEKEAENPIMKKLAIMGRHFNISTILTTQYVHMVSPVLRSNSHYSLFFNIREMQSTYQSFGNRFKNYDAFKQFYYNAIKDHKFIMYNNQEGKYNIYIEPQIIFHSF
jgi:DNA helicase HerA-like ATPase